MTDSNYLDHSHTTLGRPKSHTVLFVSSTAAPPQPSLGSAHSVIAPSGASYRPQALVGVFLGFLCALAGVAPPSARAAFFFSDFLPLFGVLAEVAAAVAAAGVDACLEAEAAAEAEAEGAAEAAAAEAAPKSAVVSCSSCDSAASPPSSASNHERKRQPPVTPPAASLPLASSPPGERLEARRACSQ